MSSSASSPSMIAQLSAVGRSHSLPLESITSLEYLYCNLQRKACLIALLSLCGLQRHTGCLNQMNKKSRAVSLACLLPEIAADADQQHGSYRSSGDAESEPEVQGHAGTDCGWRQGLSSVTPQWLLPHVSGSLTNTTGSSFIT